MTYFESDNLVIRSMYDSDPKVFYDTYLSYGWHPELASYEAYLVDQSAGTRKVFIAEYGGKVAGICTLLPAATEGPFAGMGYPLIENLSVFKAYQRMGIAGKLLDVIEAEAGETSDTVCLAVGMHYGYGAAQRIYVKRGYLPDGSGVWYEGKQLEQYAPTVNDDSLLIWMSKKLR